MEYSQEYIFTIFILTGFLFGLLFDVFRILRKSFKTSDFITYIEDIIFIILSGSILFYTIYTFNNGEIRNYVILGIIFGLIIYLLIFSKIFIKLSVKLILFIKKIIYGIFKIILYPFKILFNILRKVFLKQISFIFINIHKNMTNFIKNFSKIYINKHKNLKKVNKKKDLKQ